MTGAIPVSWPAGAALSNRLGRRLMDIILHMGAHRTATTTFQHYMRDHEATLKEQRVEFWGPHKARQSVFPGLFRNAVAAKGRNLARRAEGRIRIHAADAKARGVRTLFVSDENLLGNCKQSIRLGKLYPAAGERTARIALAFAGRLQRIVVSIRAQDLWWASACALTVSRGHPVPSPAKLDVIANSSRSWRDVITDLACAAPDIEIVVIPFEAQAGRPADLLGTALDMEAPVDTEQRWLNRSPDLPVLRHQMREQGANPEVLPDGHGRWQPFTADQTAMLRENYADDMHWLIAGADGLARLTEDARPKRADKSLPTGAIIKGQGYDEGQLERRMAQHR